MNPLQCYLNDNCRADRGSHVLFADLFYHYRLGLDGTESPEWRTPAFVFGLLTRRFDSVTRGGRRFIVGLDYKAETAIPEFVLAMGV
ncbi:MAG TPA: hypothetical protein VHY91_14570 [Pirellulales bacterium]|nr:hypothetical protein [Pirellulales bacterium]